MGRVKWRENLKRQEDPNWGSDLQAEESYPRVQGSRSVCRRKAINLVLPYEYVPFLDAYLQKKGPQFERCYSLTQHQCCVWLKAGLLKCHLWSCEREHEDQAFNLEQHFLRVCCRAVLLWNVNRYPLEELETVKYSLVMLSKPSYYFFNVRIS